MPMPGRCPGRPQGERKVVKAAALVRQDPRLHISHYAHTTLLRRLLRPGLPLAPRVAAPVARDLRVVAVVEAPEEVDGLRLPQAPDAGEGAVVQGQDRSATAEPA